MVEEFIPIVMFLVIGMALVARWYFRFRAVREQQLTVRELLSRGQEVSPELRDTLLEGLLPSPQADLRRGIISLVLGLGIVLFAWVLNDPDAERPLLGVAVFPILVGIAYVVLWWLSRPGAALSR